MHKWTVTQYLAWIDRYPSVYITYENIVINGDILLKYGYLLIFEVVIVVQI